MKKHVTKPDTASKKQVKRNGASLEPPVQKKDNSTGMPDKLKSGIENLSGIDMGDVKVHYNSSQPAQLNAHAYAQGSSIHIGPGQEKHLPHEAWHVVQQKQGRVKPTLQMKGKVNINDDKGLEHEADVMGEKALQTKPVERETERVDDSATAVQRVENEKDSEDKTRLMELAQQLASHKDEIKGHSSGEVDAAIHMIMNAVHSTPSAELSKAVESLQEKIESTGTSDTHKEPKQLSYWGVAGAISGFLLGSIIPFIGTYLGAVAGYGEGRHRSVAKGIAGGILGTLPIVSGVLTARELYQRGAVYDAINALNFAALPAAPGIFQQANFSYGSDHGGVIGSLYFFGGGNHRRIRLCHSSGPQIGGAHAAGNYQAYFPPYPLAQWRPANTQPATLAAYAAGGVGRAPAPGVPTAGNHIMEYFNLNGGRYRGRHPSRGVVNLLPALTQADINLIYHGVTTCGFNSAQLKLYMNTLIARNHMTAALGQ